MKIFTTVLLLLLSTSAFAQEQPTTVLDRTVQLLTNDIGAMHRQIAELVAKLEERNRVISELQAKAAKVPVSALVKEEAPK